MLNAMGHCNAALHKTGMLLASEGLPLIDALGAGQQLQHGHLQHHHLLHAVRAELLLKLGRHPEARNAFAQAASETKNQRERTLLPQRAADGGA